MKEQLIYGEVFMIEALMGISIILMGVYFVKSTDLPKELKDRSAQHRNETISSAKKKMVYVTEPKISTVNNQNLRDLHNKAIDELTLKITTLEQELKVNNAKNAEIQKMIDIHLESLRLLNNKSNAIG